MLAQSPLAILRTNMRFRSTLPFVTLVLLAVSPAAAQRRQPTPEQRIERLEKQVRQVQKQVFPKGQPADTAGFSDAPAATQESVSNLNNRIDAIERQLADILRASEENGNRVAVMEAELARLRADQDRRIRALETAPATDQPVTDEPVGGGEDEQAEAPPPAPRPKIERTSTETDPVEVMPSSGDDLAEAAYDQGYQL